MSLQYTEWLSALDFETQARIDNRMLRVKQGNLGDCENLKEGVFELRFLGAGPGYRIYFGKDELNIVLLLIGGIKRTQTKDIKKSKELWNEYKRSKNKNE